MGGIVAQLLVDCLTLGRARAQFERNCGTIVGGLFKRWATLTQFSSLLRRGEHNTTKYGRNSKQLWHYYRPAAKTQFSSLLRGMGAQFERNCGTILSGLFNRWGNDDTILAVT